MLESVSEQFFMESKYSYYNSWKIWFGIPKLERRIIVYLLR